VPTRLTQIVLFRAKTQTFKGAGTGLCLRGKDVYIDSFKKKKLPLAGWSPYGDTKSLFLLPIWESLHMCAYVQLGGNEIGTPPCIRVLH